ncbi:metallophosphoesterase [Microlunatus ginsengisoli]
MRRRLTILAAMMITVGSLIVGASSSSAAPHRATGRDHGSTFAVIGDIPYGAAEIAQFPAVVDQINSDPSVSWVVHLGDIKNGSSVCSDDYFAMIKKDFDGFADPLVYTVGDNEWTDCHRPNNGSYNPLERLSKVRQVFFARPGFTLGRPERVDSEAAAGYPENVRFVRSGVSFAAVHIVGSNNSMAPWTGNQAPTPDQTAEVLGRTASDVAEIRAAFATARRGHLSAVVLLTQADMFDPTATNPAFADYYAFQPVVQAIAAEAATFRRPVYLFNGDSHVYNSDRPLAPGSAWLDFYHVSAPARNLSRVTVDGSDNAKDYLRVRIDPTDRQVLSWNRVPFTS